MLAKKYRFNLSLRDNALIFNRDRSLFLSSRYFLAYFRNNKDYLKVTCISPKAAINKAAKRNFYKRLMFSFLIEKNKNENDNLLNKKIDLAIVLKRKFIEDKEKLKHDFFILLDQIIKNAKNL